MMPEGVGLAILRPNPLTPHSARIIVWPCPLTRWPIFLRLRSFCGWTRPGRRPSSGADGCSFASLQARGHGSIAARLAYLLADHVYRNNLGVVCGQDTGFKIESDPDTVRAPDVAVVCRARVGLIPSRGYAAFAPDLVAEIVSPDDRPGEVLTKVGQWIDAGTMLVWVIDPSRVEARTYRDDGGLTIVSSDGLLDASPVLPGFTCALAEVLR